MNRTNEKRRYQTPDMEITKLNETDVIVTSVLVSLTERSIKQSQVDNIAATDTFEAESSAHWAHDSNPLVD